MPKCVPVSVNWKPTTKSSVRCRNNVIYDFANFHPKITMKPHLPSHSRFSTLPFCWSASRILIQWVDHVLLCVPVSENWEPTTKSSVRCRNNVIYDFANFHPKITMKPHLPSHPRFNTSPCCWGASRILIKGVNHVNFDKEG